MSKYKRFILFVGMIGLLSILSLNLGEEMKARCAAHFMAPEVQATTMGSPSGKESLHLF